MRKKIIFPLHASVSDKGGNSTRADRPVRASQTRVINSGDTYPKRRITTENPEVAEERVEVN